MRYLKSLIIVTGFLATSMSNASTQDLDEADFNTTAASVLKIDENNNYRDNLALREIRKIGLGLGVGGGLGLYGFNIEINFEDADGAIAGVGGGDGYSSVNILWKHTYLGDTVAPYTTLGYSRWYNTGSGGDFGSSAVLDRVLTVDEKKSGQFATDFISGAVGLQYTHLQGILAGTSLFAEIVLLGDLHHGILVPTGTVGAGYYF